MRRAMATRPWLAVVAVYAASRVLSSAILAAVFALATANGWHFASHRAHATFFTFSGSWDSSAYKTIAEHGYPTTLPIDAAGHVLQNQWAFLPVFPAVTRALALVTGLANTTQGFYTAGVIVSTIAGAGAVLMLHRLLRPRVGNRRALHAVLLFSVGPMGFLLQTAYAESLFLFLLFAALCFLMERRYWLLLPFAVVAAFTRPGVLALALTLGIHVIVRFRERRMLGLPFPRRDLAALLTSTVVVSAAGLAWPVIATAVTGTPDAYLDTELSWWVGYVGRQHFAPLTPWFVMAGTHLGIAGIALVVVALAAGVWWLTRRSTRDLGPDIVGFVGSYWLYLVAVFLPQQSLVRLMMPAAPLLGSSVFGGSAIRRSVTVVAAVVLQVVAVVTVWFVTYP